MEKPKEQLSFIFDQIYIKTRHMLKNEAYLNICSKIVSTVQNISPRYSMVCRYFSGRLLP